MADAASVRWYPSRRWSGWQCISAVHAFRMIYLNQLYLVCAERNVEPREDQFQILTMANQPLPERSKPITLEPWTRYCGQGFDFEPLERPTALRDSALHDLSPGGPHSAHRQTGVQDHPQPSEQSELLEGPKTSELLQPPQQTDVERQSLLSENASTAPKGRVEGRYANAEFLSSYIPEADPSRVREKLFWKPVSKRSKLLILQTSAALSVCLCNIAFTAWAHRMSAPQKGVGTLFQGNCDSVAWINTGAHAALNVLSSLSLGAGNYCMQMLVAPSVKNLQRHHRRGDYLDIGVHSLRNWRLAPTNSKLLWIALGLISTLLHLL
jgi:hypothetical protein